MPENKGDTFPLLSDGKTLLSLLMKRTAVNMIFDGFARNMREVLPNASFVGFTGTPIAKPMRIQERYLVIIFLFTTWSVPLLMVPLFLYIMKAV